MLIPLYLWKAFIVALLISIIIPLIGTVIVLRRLSNIGEALSHTSLAGVAVGLAAGINPTVSAVILAVIASLIIEVVRKFYPKYSEISVNIVLSASIGIAAVLSGVQGNSGSFSSFLFGSILTVTDTEFFLVLGLSIFVIVSCIILYRPLFSITFDEENARLSSLPTDFINLAFSVLTAVVVSLAAKAVGALIISSLIVLPVACSMLVSKSYKSCMIISVLFAMFFTMFGLGITQVVDLKPGGTMSIIAVITLLILLPFSRRKSKKPKH